jgi:hypothetical protein
VTEVGIGKTKAKEEVSMRRRKNEKDTISVFKVHGPKQQCALNL